MAEFLTAAGSVMTVFDIFVDKARCVDREVRVITHIFKSNSVRLLKRHMFNHLIVRLRES
jgi:hypothetical protein